MARCSCRTSTDSSAIEMMGMIQKIRFSVFGLLIAVLVVDSGAYGTNAGAGSLAYSSASASADAYASAASVASAFSNADAFDGVGSFPGISDGHNGHKGIRSYDDPGHGGNSQQNRETGCSKCKWEDDDYWEKEETETEPEEKDESDCDDGDDGQYRGEHHSPGRGNKVGLSPSLQKFQAPYPTGLSSSTGTGSSANAAAIAGSSGPFGAAPVKGGYHTGSSTSTSGSPWNKVAPGLFGNKHEPGQPSNQQPESARNVDLGFASRPSWNQGYDNSRPAIVPHPSDARHTDPVSSSDGGSTDQFGGTWDKRPETGSGCSGSYQSGTGCAQGSSGPGTGNVQKHGTPDYSNTGYNLAGPLVGCSGGANNNCPGNSGETGPYATSGPIQSSPKLAGPSQTPIPRQGHYPGSELAQSPNGANDERPAISGNTGTPGIFGNSGHSTKPQNNGGTIGDTASSSTAHTETGRSFPGDGFDSNHPENGAHASNPYSPINGSPFANSGNRNPNYPGVKGGQSGDRGYSGDGKPGSGGGAYPTGSASGSKPASGHASSGAAANASSSSRHGKPGHGDSKIFYINVSPAPGSPVGVKPHSNTKGPHSGIGTTESSHQSKPRAGFGTTSSPYQQGPQAGPGTTKPLYQPAPYGDDSTAKPSHQPSPYGGGTTAKPSYQPSPYGAIGTTKPFNSNSGWPESMATNARAPVSATLGCPNGHRGCEIGSGCSSSNSKSCDQPGLLGGDGKAPEQPGGSEKYPADFSQNSQSVYPGTSSASARGGPSGNKNGGSGCTGSIGCSPGPAYVDESRTTNTLPGGAKPYHRNPFLTGELPSPGAGVIYTTPASKPIGRGNPFLEGSAASAGAWNHAGANIGTRPGGSDKNVEEPAKPIGKGNPFLAGPAHTRGDIGIGGETISGGPGVSSTNNNGPSRTTNTVPSFGGKSQAGFGGPSNHYPPGLGWNSEPSQGSSSGVKKPSATNRGSGSGGGVGVGPEGLPNFQTGHPDGNSFGGASSGAFASSQASSYANSRANSYSGSAGPAITFGQANSGNWASSGANAGSQAGSGSWSSSGASAYASSSANSWSGTGSASVKG